MGEMHRNAHLPTANWYSLSQWGKGFGESEPGAFLYHEPSIMTHGRWMPPKDLLPSTLGHTSYGNRGDGVGERLTAVKTLPLDGCPLVLAAHVDGTPLFALGCHRVQQPNSALPMLTSRPLSGMQDSSSHLIRDQEERPGRARAPGSEVGLLVSHPGVMAERKMLILHTSVVPPDFIYKTQNQISRHQGQSIKTQAWGSVKLSW